MMMQLGAEGVFVGSGIFKSGDPAQRAAAIVKATTFYDDPDVLAKVSRGLGEAMVGINVEEIAAAASARRARLVRTIRVAIEEILDLEQLEVNIYRGSVFSPDSGFLQRTFGGHVAGQSLVSAVRTVDPRYPGALAARLLPAARGCQGAPRSFSSSALRDGGSFATRRVNAIQHGETIFTMSASFQTDQSGIEHQDAMPVGAAARRPARASVGQGVRRRRVQAVRRMGRPHRAARQAQAAARQGIPAAGVVPAPRPAARRPGAAHLRAGLHERPDAVGIGAGHPSRGAQASDGGVAGPRDVVHAAVPRRRVAALRPVLAVGVRRPRR